MSFEIFTGKYGDTKTRKSRLQEFTEMFEVLRKAYFASETMSAKIDAAPDTVRKYASLLGYKVRASPHPAERGSIVTLVAVAAKPN